MHYGHQYNIGHVKIKELALRRNYRIIPGNKLRRDSKNRERNRIIENRGKRLVGDFEVRENMKHCALGK